MPPRYLSAPRCRSSSSSRTPASPHPETTSPQTPPYIPPPHAPRHRRSLPQPSCTDAPSTSPAENPSSDSARSTPTPFSPRDPPSLESSTDRPRTQTSIPSSASVSPPPHTDAQRSL